jgi:uncharacterized membrane protein
MDLLHRRYTVPLLFISGAIILTGLAAAGLLVAAAILAALLVFVLPGYAITSVFVPRNALAAPERLLFVLTVSVAVTIVGGFVLNSTTWGLQAASWIYLLGCVSVVASVVAGVVALVRRRKVLSDSDSAHVKWQLNTDGATSKLGLLVVALVITAVALKVASITAPPQGLAGYTLLWMVPLQSSNSSVVELGIDSKEFQPAQYTLRLTLAGQVLREWPSITLKPNEQWQQYVQVSMVGQPDGAQVEALLYRAEAPGVVYRRVEWRYKKQ